MNLLKKSYKNSIVPFNWTLALCHKGFLPQIKKLKQNFKIILISCQTLKIQLSTNKILSKRAFMKSCNKTKIKYHYQTLIHTKSFLKYLSISKQSLRTILISYQTLKTLLKNARVLWKITFMKNCSKTEIEYHY